MSNCLIFDLYSYVRSNASRIASLFLSVLLKQAYFTVDLLPLRIPAVWASRVSNFDFPGTTSSNDSCSGPLMTSNAPKEDTRQYEEIYVHQVYEEIASHFSSTRYKPWPIVERFLKHLAPGSIGLDLGCGNGKYLAVNPNVFILASDRSVNLVKIASQHQPHSPLVADNLSLPHPLGFFDFAISIAVVHHLSTPQRRIQAVATILELLRLSTQAETGGRMLIYVWALEQKHSRRGWDKGDDQDVMVPWVMKQGPEESKTFNRYYHLYRQGELEQDIVEAGGVILEAGYEKDNWWAIAAPKPL